MARPAPIFALPSPRQPVRRSFRAIVETRFVPDRAAPGYENVNDGRKKFRHPRVFLAYSNQSADGVGAAGVRGIGEMAMVSIPMWSGDPRSGGGARGRGAVGGAEFPPFPKRIRGPA